MATRMTAGQGQGESAGPGPERGAGPEHAPERAPVRATATGASLLPREHGAYAQLTFPLITGLAYARFHPGAVAFAVAALALFLAHEPVAVMAGVRGVRLKEALGEAARRRLAVLAGVAVLALAAAAVLAPARGWLGGLVPAALALPLVPLFGRREIKSVGAELLVAAAFSASVLPLAWCGPAAVAPAVLAAVVWLAAYVPAILGVHAVKANLKKKAEDQWTLVATPAAAVMVVLGALAAAAWLPAWGLDALAVLPPALTALVIGLHPPHPRHLKRIGWAMVTADTLALTLLLVL